MCNTTRNLFCLIFVSIKKVAMIKLKRNHFDDVQITRKLESIIFQRITFTVKIMSRVQLYQTSKTSSKYLNIDLKIYFTSYNE